MTLMQTEVLCVGETMLLLSPDSDTLLEAEALRMYTAGAESNVAVTLAHLGHAVEWFSRVGGDPVGARVLRDLGQRGVGTGGVLIDDAHRTGIYLKDWADGTSRVYYYRKGSAAATLMADDVDGIALDGVRVCHVSGINLALSQSARQFMHALVERCRARGIAVSFDVNFRPGLWTREEAAEEIREFAALCDIVIVGRDEAEALWGTTTASSVRALFPDVLELLVKDADVGATLFEGESETFVPALSVEVVEPIGAGDAFAAGFLSGWLQGSGAVRSLRLGHCMAAHVLGGVGDTPQLPPIAEIEALAALDGEAWASHHVPVRTKPGGVNGKDTK